MDAATNKLAYTVEEAAKLLSLSRANVYRLIDAGRLGSIRIGRSRRITAGQLARFITQCEQESVAEDARVTALFRELP